MLIDDSNAWRTKSLGLLACCGVFIGGCSEYRVQRAAASPASQLSAHLDKQATICVFRAHGLGTSVVAPVTDNGVVVGATEGSSFFCYAAEPGRHELRVSDAAPVQLEVIAGQGYYLAHDLNVSRDRLVQITQESAHELTAWCDSLELSRAPETVAVLERGAVARAEPVHDLAPVRVVRNEPNPEPPAATSAERPASTNQLEGALAADRRVSEGTDD